MNKNKTAGKLIALLVTGVVFAFVGSTKAYADKKCEALYGGGEVCEYSTKFKITKEVRIKGDNSWKDKVTNVKEGETVEFRITIKNRSDSKADDADDMKMEDFLPKEMTRVGGSGLTEYWSNFDPGDEKRFIIEARVKADEYKKDTKFEKCVVNKAELRQDGDFEGSDTATVCYGNVEPSELPKTGAMSTLALTGIGLLFAGFVTKKSFGK